MSDDDHPSATSQVRANTVHTIAEGIRVGQAASSHAISQKQIGMIFAVITSVAAAVTGLFSLQTSNLRDDHAAVITRMEDSQAGSLTRIESMYEGRVSDLKTQSAQLGGALETCLQRE